MFQSVQMTLPYLGFFGFYSTRTLIPITSRQKWVSGLVATDFTARAFYQIWKLPVIASPGNYCQWWDTILQNTGPKTGASSCSLPPAQARIELGVWHVYLHHVELNVACHEIHFLGSPVEYPASCNPD